MKNILAFLLGLFLMLAVLFFSFDSPFPNPAPTDAPGTVPTSGTTAPTTAPVTESTTAPSTEPIVYDLPMSAIVLTEQIEQSLDEAGNVCFSYAYPNVRLYLSDEAISNAVTLDLLNRIDITRDRADTVREDAADISGTACFYQVRYTPERIDGTILSLSGTMTSFTGGAHPSSSCVGITYDLITGKALTLTDILTEQCAPDDLCRLVVDALTLLQDQSILYSDFAVSVEDRFSGGFHNDESWYLSREGLCFTFEPYEVGPYASGIITAVIPYDQLPGYLKDEWFPPEQIDADGTLTVEPLSESTADPFASPAELAPDPDAEGLILHTQSILYDISISTTGPDALTLFAADHLTSGDTIVVRSASPLQITYTVAGETHSQTLSPT